MKLQPHPDDIGIYHEAEELAFRLADHIGKELRWFEHKRRPFYGSATGLCYVEEKRISVTIRYKHYKDEGGHWYKFRRTDKDIFEDTAHEVAHLMHKGHGKEFRKLEKELIALALKWKGIK